MSPGDREGSRPVERGVPDALSALYREVILDHYRRPRNRGPLKDATHSVTMNNPLCGDRVELHLVLEEDRIADAGFEGRGCSISQASASMMTEAVTGLRSAEALELAERFRRLVHGDEEAARDEALGDLRALAGVARFPVRVRCALLGFDCLRELVGIDGPAPERRPDGSDPAPGEPR